ncbi:MAG TPA: spore coat protein U domain-containing protein [Burkholderiaceae bacterium]|nr:spore coat protein U domain-containing protein [Burkholderiaceae bacterium]
MKISIRLIAAGLLAVGLPLAASAQTITINATVNSQCNIGNATVNLGALNLAAQTDNILTSITLTCNKGATVSVALNNGANASGTQKRMQRGATGDFLNYSITVPGISGVITTCPALPGTSWDATNTFAATNLYTASGGPRSVLLCVSVPSGQFSVGAGNYTDTVTATLTVS